MKRRLSACVAATAAAVLALSACSSSKSNSNSNNTNGNGGNVSLKLVVADYGTGPSNSSQAYWQGIISDFHAANPTISV